MRATQDRSKVGEGWRGFDAHRERWPRAPARAQPPASRPPVGRTLDLAPRPTLKEDTFARPTFGVGGFGNHKSNLAERRRGASRMVANGRCTEETSTILLVGGGGEPQTWWAAGY